MVITSLPQEPPGRHPRSVRSGWVLTDRGERAYGRGSGSSVVIQDFRLDLLAQARGYACPAPDASGGPIWHLNFEGARMGFVLPYLRLPRPQTVRFLKYICLLFSLITEFRSFGGSPIPVAKAVSQSAATRHGRGTASDGPWPAARNGGRVSAADRPSSPSVTAGLAVTSCRSS